MISFFKAQADRIAAACEVLGIATIISWVLLPAFAWTFDWIPYPPDVRRVGVVLLAIGTGLRFWKEGGLRDGLPFRLWTGISSQKQLTSRLVFSFLGCSLLLAVLSTFAFRFTLFDVGLFHQVIWSLSNGHGFLSTISGSGNHILDHLSLSFVLLVPFFKAVGGAPWFLPVVQSFLLNVGLSAWCFHADRCFKADSSLNRHVRLGLFAIFFCMNSVWANLAWGFHETSFAFAGFSWAYALFLWTPEVKVTGSRLAKMRTLLLGFALLIGALSKETALLDGAVFCLGYAILNSRRVPKNAVVAGLTAACFLGLFVWFELLPKPADKNYIARYYGYLGADLTTFAKNLLLHPYRVVNVIGARELGRFFLSLLAPFLGLPLFFLYQSVLWIRKKSVRPVQVEKLFLLLCTIAPNILTMALSTHPDLRMERFHYVMALWPALAMVSISTFKSLTLNTNAKKGLSLLGVWIVVSQLTWSWDPISIATKSMADLRATWGAQRAFADIGPDDSVVADERVGAWLSNRKMITRWPEFQMFKGHCPKWIVLGKELAGQIAQHPCGLSAHQVLGTSDAVWTLYMGGGDEK